MNESDPLTSFLKSQLPEWFFRPTYGTPLWVWLALPLLLLLVLVIVRCGSTVVIFVLKKSGRCQGKWVEGAMNAGKTPVELLVGTGLFRGGKTFFPMSGYLQVFLNYLELAVMTVAVIWLALRLTGTAGDRLGSYLSRRQRSHARAMIPLGRKVVKTSIVLIGIIFLLQNLNVNVSAMLAGLGIGGLALALAGKKTVENLFGGIALVMDQPARVGDPCNYEGGTGTIGNVGLRSTRIRTPERTVVTIPNSKLTEMQIENIAWRDRILLKTILSLRYETTPEQMRTVLEGVRLLLANRPEIAEGGRITLNAFSQTSLDLEVFAYVMTSDYNEFLKVREEVFLSIMDVVAGAGTAFYTPSSFQPGTDSVDT